MWDFFFRVTLPETVCFNLPSSLLFCLFLFRLLQKKRQEEKTSQVKYEWRETNFWTVSEKEVSCCWESMNYEWREFREGNELCVRGCWLNDEWNKTMRDRDEDGDEDEEEAKRRWTDVKQTCNHVILVTSSSSSAFACFLPFLVFLHHLLICILFISWYILFLIHI